MAVYKRDIVDINLETGNIHRSFLKHSIGYKDAAADHFGIRVFRNGEPVNLTGVSIQGIFMPPQGSPIAITSGNIVNYNEAEVVLPQVCYNYNGQFTLAIKLVDPSNAVTGTMRIVDGMVDNTHASGTVAPTEAVPGYEEVLATYEQAIAAINKTVRFDTTQSLTDTQKATARSNISAPSVAEMNTAVGNEATARQNADALKVNISDIENDLTGTTAGKVLDARQGKVLDDKITAEAATRAAADSDLKSAFDDVTGNKIIDFVWGYYINTSGSTVNINSPTSSTSGYGYAVVNCSEGDVFTVNSAGGNSPRAWCFIDSSSPANVLLCAAASAQANDTVIIAPENSAKLIINAKNTDKASYAGRNIKTEIKTIKDAIYDAKALDFWSSGTMTYATGEPDANDARIRLTRYVGIPQSIPSAYVLPGYEFTVYAWNYRTGEYIGVYTTSGTFAKSGTTRWFREFSFGAYPNYQFRLVLRNAVTPTATMTTAEGANLMFNVDRFETNVLERLQNDERFINSGVYSVTKDDLESGTRDHGELVANANRGRCKSLIPVRAGMLVYFTPGSYDLFFSVIDSTGENVQIIGWSTSSSVTSPITITADGFLQIMIANPGRETEVDVTQFDGTIEIVTVTKQQFGSTVRVVYGTFSDTTKTLADLEDNTITRCYGDFDDKPEDIPSTQAMYIETIRNTGISRHQKLVTSANGGSMYYRSTNSQDVFTDWKRIDSDKYSDEMTPVYVAIGPSTCRGQIWREGEAVTRTDYPYPEYFGKVCNFNVYNLANGGTGCISRNTELNPHPNFMDVVYDPANATKFQNARLVTIEMPRGNDAAYTFGEIDDYFDYEDCIQNHAGNDNGYTWMQEHATCLGALNYCITKIFSMNQFCKIVLITGIRSVADRTFTIDKTNGKITYSNSTTPTRVTETIAALKAIRDQTGIPIIIPENGSYVCVYNGTLGDDGQLLGHDGHPTNEGYLAQARFISGQLEAMFKH